MKTINPGIFQKSGIFFVLVVLLMLCCLGSLNTPHAATPLYVNGTSGNDSWDGTSPVYYNGTYGPMKTIQTAVNAVDTGGTVNVAEGTYNEHVTISKNINLVGINPQTTIIDGTGTGQVINVAAVSNVNISNFTIKNGYSGDGAGIYSLATLNVNNCIITSNNATGSGGGIYAAGSTTINNSVITGNKAYNGGGIAYGWNTITIRYSRLTSNTATNGREIYKVSTSTIDAQNNWWGQNSGPQSGQIFGTATYSPWLYMTFAADNDLILLKGTSTLTANFNNIYDGSTVTPINPASGHIPDGSAVTFTTDLGSVGSLSTVKNTVNGIAAATLTPSGETGTAHLTATLDNQTLSTDVGITDTLYVNEKYGDDSFDGLSPTYISGTRGPMQTITKALDTIMEGGAVNVAEGTYQEDLVLTRNVNLVGNGSANSIIIPVNPEDVTVTITTQVTGALINGFTIQGATSGTGILIEGSGIVIQNNDILNNLYGITIAEGGTADILCNNIKDNEIGIKTRSNEVKINFNRIVHNNLDIETEIDVDASYNWWGTNNPSKTSGANIIPWLYMTISTNPAPILVGGTSQIIANFNNAYDGSSIIPLDPALGHLPDDCVVTFTTNLGSVGSKTTSKNTTNGIATATLTADEGTGTADLTALLDWETVDTTLAIVNTLYVNGATGNDSWNGLNPTYLSGTTGPMKTIQTAINAIGINGTIFVASGTYPEHLTVSKSLTLNGAGLGQTILDGTNNGRVIVISASNHVTINQLTIQNGNSTSSGGGIYNAGVLTINNSTIANNTAMQGGGIYNYRGVLNINYSNLTGNTVSGGTAFGGAIFDSEGSVTLNNSTLNGNIAPSGGGAGALYEYNGATNINNCTIAGNSAGYGGAIATIGISVIGGVHPDHSPITIINSIISNNSANTGGAIGSDGRLIIYNSTITGNTAGTGGTIYKINGTATMNFNRISGGSNIITNLQALTFDAQNNWWGTNSNPSSLFAGYVNYTPWLYMTINATPTTLTPGQSSLLTVNFNNIYNGTTLTPIDPASGHLPDGSMVTFGTDRGSVGSKITTKLTLNGITTANLTALANEGTGIAHASAQLDNQNLTININIANPIRYVNAATGNDTWDGTTAEWITGTVGPKKTIQSAINVVEANGIIYTAPGTYAEHPLITKNLALIGAGQNMTFIDGTNNGHTGILGSVVNITGITIQNGNSYYGGGIVIGSGSTLNIINSTLTSNTAKYGGAIYNEGCTLNIDNCNIIGNSATGTTEGIGGAIFMNGEGSTTITNSTITGNTARLGGFYWGYGTGVLHFNRISGNTPNTITNAGGTINAQNNWWGSNLNPSSQFSGTVNYSPWIYMTFTSEPNPILNHATSILTADFNHAYDGVILVNLDPALGHLPSSPVTFTTDLGSVGSKITIKNTDNGIATATLTADESPGAANLTAQLDNQIAMANVIIIPVRYVNGATGNDSWDGGSPVWVSGLIGPLKTIQSAVNAIETGGTVSVASGTYMENLIIEKPVNIVSAGLVTVQASNTGFSVFTINNAGLGTTIQGLNITGGSNGVFLSAANNCSILNNTITNNNIGILVMGNQNNITSNNVTSNGWAGICLNGVALNTVNYNLVEGNQEGIYITDSANNTFQGNLVSDNGVNGMNIQNGGQNTLQNNMVTNSGVSVLGNGIVLKNTSLNTLDGNTVSGSGWSGIVVDNSSQNSFINAGMGGNTITGNGNGMVLYGGSNNNIITNNNIIMNLYNGLQLFVGCEGNQIHDNQINSNGVTGLLIQMSDNNNITDNNVSNSNFNGIALDNSNGNNLQGNNILSSGSIGLIMVSSNSNTLLQNQVISTFWSNIVLDMSNQNTLQGNTINGNNISQNGIWFQKNCDQNYITNNTVTLNTANGINIRDSQNNTIDHNNITINGVMGLLMFASNNTVIYQNTFHDNGFVGTCLVDGSTDNTLTENNYISTTTQTTQAWDTNTNTYNNETTGNYWNNWETTSPRPIAGGGSSVDNHPRTTPF